MSLPFSCHCCFLTGQSMPELLPLWLPCLLSYLPCLSCWLLTCWLLTLTLTLPSASSNHQIIQPSPHITPPSIQPNLHHRPPSSTSSLLPSPSLHLSPLPTALPLTNNNLPPMGQRPNPLHKPPHILRPYILHVLHQLLCRTGNTKKLQLDFAHLSHLPSQTIVSRVLVL